MRGRQRLLLRKLSTTRSNGPCGELFNKSHSSALNKSHSSALNKCLCRPRKDLVESARIKALASNQSSCPFSMAMKPLVSWRYGHESSCFCSNKLFFSRYGHRSRCSYFNMLPPSPCSNMPTEALVLLMSFDVCAIIRQHTPAYISIRRPLVVGLRGLVARVPIFSPFLLPPPQAYFYFNLLSVSLGLYM
jgi:hypothetical protein